MNNKSYLEDRLSLCLSCAERDGLKLGPVRVLTATCDIKSIVVQTNSCHCLLF